MPSNSLASDRASGAIFASIPLISSIVVSKGVRLMLSALTQRRFWLLSVRVLLPWLLALAALGVLSWNIGVLRAAPASGVITGVAFRDANVNGVRDSFEAGVMSVTVTAYDASGVVQGVAATTATGAYTLTAAGTGPYRIEFTNWPANLYPGVFGASSATTVQFVPDGNSSNVNVSLNLPAQSCASGARLVTSEFVVGDNSTQMAPNMVSYYYTASGNFGAYPQDTLSRCDYSGSIFGLAYQRSTDTLFGAAYVRRRAGQGPSNSTGTIYKITGAMTLSHTTSIFIELNGAAGISTGVNIHPNGMPAGQWLTDTQAYTLTSKIGLGDLEISDDEQTLYVVNLNQRELIVLPLGPGPTPPPAASILRRPAPIPASCNGDGVTAPASSDVRPFGLKFYDGSLYLGMVCSGQSMMESTYFTATTIAQLAPVRAAMRGYVYRFDAVSNTFDSTPVLEFPLNYPRLQVNDGFPTAPTNDGEWLPWSDVWRPAYAPYRASGNVVAQPQPLLTDIEFDGLGYMMLGFRDRFSDQAYAASDPGPNNGALVNGRMGGDVLLACQDAGGNWVLESGGTCNARATATPRADSGPGPAGTQIEFYHSERYNPYHEETAMGGLGLLYGTGELVSSAFDVLQTFEAGTMVFSNTTGNKMRAAQLYAPNSGFSKGGGLGDVEVMCLPAPVEIGNRVWLDPPHDGVQDPGETPIAGVTVHLYTITGTLISTATTSAAGEYYFSSGPGVDTASARYNLPLQFGASYSVRLDNAADYTGAGALTGLFLTETDDSIPSPSGSDINDNDAISTTNPVGSPAGVWPVIDLTVGGAGQNDHTHDFGFSPIPAAVELLYFDIESVSGAQVTLGWATASEVDNFGFNLYRASVNDFSPAAAIHFEPSAVPGGTGGGATYGYVDTVPQPGAWWYWLEDLDTQGHATLHGPVSTVASWAASLNVYLPILIHR
jgi:hypothetical protein